MSATGDRTRPTHRSLNWVWDVNLLTWVAETQPGGGSGGAVTVANGADVAQGTTTDVAWVSGAGTVISLLKKIASAGGSAVSIADGSDVAEGLTTDAAVQGDNPGTLSAKLRGLNKSVAAGLPVTNTNLDATISSRLKPADTLTKVATVDTITNPVAVTGTFFQATQPVSIASMPSTPVTGPLTDTQLRATAVPVSGTVTANAGTNLNTSALALEAGHLATIDAHIPAQGQAAAAASMPVVLPAAQITTLTPPAAITGFALDATVAKDASLVTIDTDLKATQPRSITNFPATQAVSMASGASPDLLALYNLNQSVVVQLLTDIRTELRILNTVSASGLNVKDDLDGFRSEPTYLN